MGISDLIACFISDMMDSSDGTAELQRVELANKFGCVPSQINYVISTRFSPERGYIVESRRGGGGYIRIRRVRTDPKLLLMHTVNAIGDEVDLRTALALLSNALEGGSLDSSAAALMEAAVSDNSLRAVPGANKNAVRAAILKQMLMKLM